METKNSPKKIDTFISCYFSSPYIRAHLLEKELVQNDMSVRQKTLYLFYEMLSFEHESFEWPFCVIQYSKTVHHSQAILVLFERASLQLAFLLKQAFNTASEENYLVL